MSAKIIALIIVPIIFAGLIGMLLGKLTYENDTLLDDLIKKETPIIQEQPSHEGPIQPALIMSNSTQIDKEPALILSDSTK